jgi:predicted DNA-binding transcriptional regulator AlpA
MQRTSSDKRARREARARLAAARAAALVNGDGLLRLPEVLAAFPVSRSTFLKGVKEGRYPAPVRIGSRAVAWRAADIRALIEAATPGRVAA